MSTHIPRMDCEDQETPIFHSYPCAYYVQSPSTISHANSSDIRGHTAIESTIYSPTRSETNTTTATTTAFLNKNNLEVSRFTLSRYSSSRGSNNSFLHDQKKAIADDNDGPTDIDHDSTRQNRQIIVDHHHGNGDDEEDEDWHYGSNYKKGIWWRYFSFRRSNSCAWISLQISWRLLFSLGIALLVFYISTKPPTPKISIKKAEIHEFGLGEGVDGTGVTTKILTCNCSIDLLIDNKSKLFGLHVHPPTMEMSFGRLSFASSHGPKLYAAGHGSTLFDLYVGTRNKPMYGAGRTMEDMLESGRGLPLIMRLRLTSNYRVVWDLIKPKFYHEVQCLLVLNAKYDKKHRTQTFNSTCSIKTFN